MTDLHHEIWITESPQKIFEALTTHNGLTGWWTTHVEKNENNEITFGFNNKTYWFTFKINKQEPHKTVQWECINADPQSQPWIGTKINWDISHEDNTTTVRMAHTNWSDTAACVPSCNSTWGHLMFSLKSYVETGKGQPMN